MSKFQLPSASVSPNSTPANLSTRYASDYDEDDDNDIDSLPYPGELPRNDFLAPDFDPQTYLSTLRNRHQTLEDLRSDLRRRGQLLNKELLDLVNGNYEEFLSLGSDLKGGEERIESVRVGLLGFQREVEGIQKGVKERAEEVKRLVEERKDIRRDIALGRSLLEVEERVGELEGSLGINFDAEEEDLEESEDEDEELTAMELQLKRIQQHAQQFVLISRMMHRVGSNHPFLEALQPRLDESKRVILLDLAAALRQAKTTKKPDITLAIAKVYSELGDVAEGAKVLKGG